MAQQPASVVLATAGYDHTIRFWEASTGMCWRTVQYPDSQINAIEISPDKNYLVAAGNPHARLFDINSNNPNPLYSYDGHTSNVTAVGFQKDGRWMFTGSEDGSIKIWDLRAPGCQRNYETQGKAAVNTVRLHPNQSELISGDHSGVVRVWDLSANECSSETPLEGEVAVQSVSVAADGSTVVAANNSGMVFMWSPLSHDTFGRASDIPIKKTQAHQAYILKTQLSPDGRYLATASADHTVKVWNLPDLTLEKVLTKHQRWVWDCVFSADSSYLLTASPVILAVTTHASRCERLFVLIRAHVCYTDHRSDHSARLWDLAQGEMIRHYTGHHKAVTSVALNDSS